MLSDEIVRNAFTEHKHLQTVPQHMLFMSKVSLFLFKANLNVVYTRMNDIRDPHTFHKTLRACAQIHRRTNQSFVFWLPKTKSVLCDLTNLEISIEKAKTQKRSENKTKAFVGEDTVRTRIIIPNQPLEQVT